MAHRPIDLTHSQVPAATVSPRGVALPDRNAMRPPASDLVLGAIILGCFGLVFAIDAATPADRIIVCFLYVIPLFAALAGTAQPVTIHAAAASALIVTGALVQPPPDQAAAAFYASRALALAAVWIAATWIAARKRTEAQAFARFEEERQKAQSRGEFLDLLSHEVGVSLTAIEGQAFCLRKHATAASPDSDGVAARAEKIHNSVNQIKTMVQRIQRASEAGERALRARCEPVDLRALVMEAVQQAGAASPERTIAADIGGLPAVVRGDPCMLKQVVGNLLSNAVKYSPPAAPVRVEGRSEGGRAVLTVSDCGRGIPADEQARLFAPHYRARNSTGVDGAGIGLYVCDRFVSSHGGTIAIASRLDAGTTVTIRLPIDAKPSDPGHAATSNPLH